MQPQDSTTPGPTHAKFDAYAETYESLHANSIGPSGEQPSYFADYKADCLERLVGKGMPDPVLDYGCGIGELTERLVLRFPVVEGYDPSEKSLEVAAAKVPSAQFHRDPGRIPQRRFGLVILANVLHHVPLAEREGLLGSIARLLLPERGRLVIFEHNPYHPLARWSVAHCPFDDDAVLLGPVETRGLVRRAGFVPVRSQFIVFFPRALAFLRKLEPKLGWLPAGAQVMTVARLGSPGSSAWPKKASLDHS